MGILQSIQYNFGQRRVSELKRSNERVELFSGKKKRFGIYANKAIKLKELF